MECSVLLHNVPAPFWSFICLCLTANNQCLQMKESALFSVSNGLNTVSCLIGHVTFIDFKAYFSLWLFYFCGSVSRCISVVFVFIFNLSVCVQKTHFLRGQLHAAWHPVLLRALLVLFKLNSNFCVSLYPVDNMWSVYGPLAMMVESKNLSSFGGSDPAQDIYMPYVVNDITTFFTLLVGIYFPSVTGEIQ